VAVTKPQVFFRQLATMLDAGLPIARSLNTLVGQTHGPLAKVVRQLYADVDAGNGFAESAEKFPSVFNALERNLLHAGQMTGRLEMVLVRMAENREFWHRLSKQIIGKLIYPCILLHVAFFVNAIVKLFQVGTGAALGALVGLIPIYILVGFIIALLKYGERLKPLREFFDTLFYHLPIFSKVTRKLALARYARAFQAMYQSGVSVLHALPMCAASCGNAVMERKLAIAGSIIQGGDSLTTALTATGAFDTITLSMILTGEESGNLDTMLDKIAEMSELEASTAIDRLGTLFPFIIYIIIVIMIMINIVSFFAGYVKMINDTLN
jgi:type IV pilus assembly protein PilC